MIEEESYHITEKGYQTIWNWMRLTAQMCEMEHEGNCQDLSHEVAFTLCFLLPTPEEAKSFGVFE